jgi:predicted permease
MIALPWELRLVTRSLRKTPAFTLTAVLSLAVGIGATTAVYAVIDATLLRPLPVRDPVRLFTLTYGFKSPTRGSIRLAGVGYSTFRALERDGSAVLAGVAAYDEKAVPLDTGDEIVNARVLLVSGGYFSTLGVPAVRGRAIEPDDARLPGSAAVAVLSDACWKAQFAGDPNVLGRTVRLGGAAFTVIGVAPPRFGGLELGAAPHVFIPLTMAEEIAPGNFFGDTARRGFSPQSWVTVAGRLRPDVTPEQAEAVLLRIPVPDRFDRAALEPTVARAVDEREDLRRFSLGLMAASLACLLIACVNLAGLLLARAEERRMEAGVRAALGAGALRLALQPLAESVAIALVGTAGGVLLARWILQAMRGLSLPGGLDMAALDLALDPHLVSVAAAGALTTAVVFGGLPAWHVWRSDALSALRARTAGDRRPSALRAPLLAAQVALCVPLVAGATLLAASLRHGLALSSGFDRNGLLDVEIRSQERVRVDAALRALADRLRGAAGIEALDLYESGSSSPHLYVDGRTCEIPRNVRTWRVGPDYFRTLGLEILRGRALDGRDVAGAAKTAVVDETLAAMLFPGQEAVGRTFAFWPPDEAARAEPYEVVGVARAARYDRIFEEPRSQVYTSLAQEREHASTLLLRHRGDAAAVATAVRTAARAVDPGLPPPRLGAMAERIRRQLAPQRLGAAFLGLFAVVALVLTAVGLYGLLAYAVLLRRAEIGVRMALGAEPRHILGLVLGRAVRIVLAGLAAGLPLALASGRLLARLLHGVRAADPARLLLSAAMLIAVALVACYLPARRAAAIDPTRALRCE